MFEFVTKLFKKGKNTKEPVKAPMVKPKKILPEPEEPPKTDSGIVKREGHIDFGKTKSITRKFKKMKIRESLEERREAYYDKRGNLFDR
jgi:hypothetical protein